MRLNRDHIRRLLEARHPCIRIVTDEEAHARALVWDVAGALGLHIRAWTAVSGLHDAVLEPGPSEQRDALGTETPAAALFKLSHDRTPHVAVAFDLAPHLHDPVTLRALRELIERFRAVGSRLVMIDHTDQVPAVIAGVSARVEIALPDGDELREIVRRTVRGLHRARPISVEINRRQLDAVIRNLTGLTRAQAEQVVIDVCLDDNRFSPDDVERIVARKRQFLHVDGLLEFVEAPRNLDDVGGLDALKAWLRERERSFDDDACEHALTPPRGVLLLGVQGAGKSLCAKAIATAWQRPLLRLDPGALYDRFVGESERRLRQSLAQAESMAPIVLWIDEIEKGFASAASHSTDGGLSQRMFGALLTWMQEHRAPVFLVATANNIDALPPELLRKGRFDEIFFVDLPREPARRAIFAIHLRARKRDPSAFDLDALASAGEGFSGAEIEQAVVSALHKAFAASTELTTDTILAALRASPPLSVTMHERVEALRRWAAGRCAPAD